MKEINIVKIEEKKNTSGQPFNTYKAVTKNNKLIDVRFRRSVPDNLKPTEVPCVLLVDEKNMNIAKNQLYPCLWINQVEDVIEPERKIQPELDELF